MPTKLQTSFTYQCCWQKKKKEKLITNRWVKHKMLSVRQFGFKEKSCVRNLVSYYDRVAVALQERDGWVDF